MTAINIYIYTYIYMYMIRRVFHNFLVQYAPIPNQKSWKYFWLFALFILVEGILLVNKPSISTIFPIYLWLQE